MSRRSTSAAWTLVTMCLLATLCQAFRMQKRTPLYNSPLCATSINVDQGARNDPNNIANVGKLQTGFRPVNGLIDGMAMRRLGRSDLVVSQVGLGTLTLGEQTNEAQSFELLDIATKNLAINFLDTAEIYPLPYKESNSGESERIVGKWLRQQGSSFRENIILSSKICGYSDTLTWCRKEKGEGTRLTKEQIHYAVDKQLERLQTDYIDLLQFNWPERYVPFNGEPGYDPRNERSDFNPIRTQLEAVAELIASGKVRNFGLSNESPYGVGVITTMADLLGLPRPCSTQQELNLLERYDFERGMMEACSPNNGDVSVLTFSPLGGGALTGKYQDFEEVEMNARIKRYPGMMYRYISPPARELTKYYSAIADEADLPFSVLSLAWVYSQPYVASTFIGVTDKKQLKDNVQALNIAPLSEGMLEEIDHIYRKNRLAAQDVFQLEDIGMEYVDPDKLPWGAKDSEIDPELDSVLTYKSNIRYDQLYK